MQCDYMRQLKSVVVSASNATNYSAIAIAADLAENHLFGKELFIRISASAVRKLPSIYVFSLSLLVLRAGCGI